MKAGIDLLSIRTIKLVVLIARLRDGTLRPTPRELPFPNLVQSGPVVD